MKILRHCFLENNDQDAGFADKHFQKLTFEKIGVFKTILEISRT